MEYLHGGNAGSKILHKTIQLQKYAIHKAAYNSHTDPLFNKSQILKLTDLYEYESVLFIYDFVENNLPRSFGDVFRYNRDVQNIRRTRQSDMIHVYRCHTIFSSRLSLYTLPIIWVFSTSIWATREIDDLHLLSHAG